MNSLVQTLNHWGAQALSIAWPMLWQSSLLIAVLFVLDLALRAKVRAAVRYAFWLLVLVKLVLPPSFALPTSAAWWLRSNGETSQAPPRPTYVVRSGPATVPVPRLEKPTPAALLPNTKPHLSAAGWALVASTSFSALLLGWMLFRWCQILGRARCAIPAPVFLDETATHGREQAKLPRHLRIKLTDSPLSPAVCGLFRPVILIPASLMDRLAPSQLRAVLLHELFHIRRGDVWVNLLQSLLQILYWWHPLLWLANTRIRRLREEAVDDCVMLALCEDADTYAPTLLEVAKMTLERPLASLGLVGIVESKSTLRRRIERLMNVRKPSRTSLTVQAIVGICAFSALALPMGEPTIQPGQAVDVARDETNPWPDSRFAGYREVDLEAQFFITDAAALQAAVPSIVHNNGPLVVGASELASVRAGLKQANVRSVEVEEQLRPKQFSGGEFRYQVGGVTNYQVNYQTREFGGKSVTTGAQIELPAGLPDWVPLKLSVVPWAEGDAIRCEMEMLPTHDSNTVQRAEVSVPKGSALLWAAPEDPRSGKRQIVMLAQHGTVSIHDQTTLTEAASGTQTDASSLAPLRAWIASHQATQEAINQTKPAEQTSVPAAQIDAPRPSEPSLSPKYFHSSGRRSILSKLQSIRLDKGWNGLPLSEVIKDLGDESRKRDPEKRGINFIITPNADSAAASFDPTTGLPVAAAPAEPIDIGATLIKFPIMPDVRLADVLDAIITVADKPITYSVEDYAVVFSLKSRDPVPMFVRTFRIDLEAMRPALEQFLSEMDWIKTASAMTPCVDVFGRTNETCLAFQALHEFMLAEGIDFSPPKSMFFSYGEKSMLVRATENELDRIEATIQALTNRAGVISQPATVKKAIASAGAFTEFAKRMSVPRISVKNGLLDPYGSSGRASGTQTQLFTRTFKLDPHTVKVNLERLVPQTNSSAIYGVRSIKREDETQDRLREFLRKSGIDLTTPKGGYWNYREGVFLCRATIHDLELIEQAMEALNVPPQQVNIGAKFFEIRDAGLSGLLAWLATSDSVNFKTNKAPHRTVRGVLSAAQFSVVIRALEQRGDVNLLGESSVTTLSGRQTEIQFVEETTMATAPNANPGIPMTSTNVDQTLVALAGPTLYIVPNLAEDGRSIRLTIVGKVSELVGNYDPRQFVPRAEVIDAPAGVPDSLNSATVQSSAPHVAVAPLIAVTQAHLPLPHLTLRQVSTTTTVQDGETLMLVGLPNTKDIGNLNDTVPILGDVSGRVPLTQTNGSRKRIILIFVTPSLLDPAGNPIHGQARLPSPRQ